MPLFKPEKMVRVEIDFPRRYIYEVTKTIAELGYFQPENISGIDIRKDPLEDIDLVEIGTKIAGLKADLTASLARLEIPIPDKVVGKLEVIENPDVIINKLKSIRDQVQKLSVDTDEIRRKIEEKQGTLALLEPFKDLQYDLSALRNRRYLYSILGIMPTSRIERFKQSLSQIPFVLIEEPQSDKKSQVLLLGPRNQRDFMILTARSAYVEALDIPDDVKGSLPEVIKMYEQEVDKLKAELVVLEQQKTDLRTTKTGLLEHWYSQVQYSSKLYDIISYYGHLRHSFLVAGWVPANKQNDFLKILDGIGPDVLETVEQENELDQNAIPPVAIKLPRQLRGFNKLVTTYSTPWYKEIDPTILVTITFPLLFGAMFGDLGQGAVLALAGLLLSSRKVKLLRKLANFGWVLTACGVVSMIFGALYGSVFGFEEVFHPVWLSPLNDIMRLLITTLAGGAILLSLADILSIINAIIRKDWVNMIFSGKGIAGLLLYWALIGLVLSMVLPSFAFPRIVLIILIIVCILMMMSAEFIDHLVHEKRPLFKGGFLLYFITAFFELFEIFISLLSNSLSYVRVGAFAVAHAGLSQVVMILAEMVSPVHGASYWIVIVLGNLFIIGFEGMIVSIQTLRLEYYEFFSKFFRGGGVRYQPLNLSEK